MPAGEQGQPVGVAHPHGGVEAAQMGIKGGIAGGCVPPTIAEGAIEQQQAAGAQQRRSSGHQIGHRSRRHDVDRVGAEHGIEGTRGPGPCGHIEGHRIGQVTAGGGLAAALTVDALLQRGQLPGPFTRQPVQLVALACDVHRMLAAARAHLQHPCRPRQPARQRLGDGLLVAFAGFRKLHSW